jgi:NTP pyrophosphatase (non-canonical NTP hydrolase)
MNWKKELNEFNIRAYRKFQRGRKEHGEKFSRIKIKKELEDELLDISNYAFMMWMRIRKLK